MSITEHEKRELQEAIRVDEHGIEPIPDSGRDSTAMQQFWIWAGSNLVPISWVVGTVGPALGLSLVESIIVMLVGTAIGAALFGLVSLMGHRTAVNQMVLSRAPLGRRGGYVPAALQFLTALSWVGINTYIVLDLALGVLKELGIEGGTGTKYVVAVFIMLAQILIGIWGFYAIRTFEKYTVPVVGVVMLIMTGLAVAKVGDINWTSSTVSGKDKFTAMTQLFTTVGIGWGLSWIAWASDYTRFVPRSVSERKVFWATSLGTFVPLGWLAVLGAVTSAATKAGDPASIVASLFGVMTVPVLIVILHGPLGSNILNIYSASLNLLSLDVKVRRPVASLITGVISFGILVAFIESSNFATTFVNYMSSIVVWTTAWLGVVLVDYFLLRRQQLNVPELYAPPSRSIYGDFDLRGLGAFLVGLVVAWSFQYGYVEAFQGPLARATGNVDFSWAGGLGVGGLVYYVLQRARIREPSYRPAVE